MILIAPRKIYEELFKNKERDSYALQSRSLCGRKVVSWSEKIDLNNVAKICINKHITPNELLFSASSSALYAFLEEFPTLVPDNLDACARYVERDHLLENTDYSDGMYCLKKVTDVQVVLQV